MQRSMPSFSIAMLSIHSSPMGTLGTRDTGGMSVYINALAVALGRAGHRVDIFTRRTDADSPEVSLLAPNVRLVLLDIAGKRQVSKADLFDYGKETFAAIESFRIRRSLTYDLVHSHYWISGHVGRLAHRSWHRPHVITFHTLAALKSNTGVGAAEPPRRLAEEQALVDECDGLLVPCEGEMNHMMHYYKADPGKATLVMGGIDRQRFQPMDKPSARQRLGVDMRDLMLLCVGRLTPQKGQDRIIEALARLGDEHRARLILVGGNGQGDPEQTRLYQLADELGIVSQVRFCGSVPQTELAEYYAAMDMLVLASHYESFGLVGLEALACGRPVVTTPVGIMKTLSSGRQTGLVVTAGSSEAIAAAIASAIEKGPGWAPHAIHRGVRDYTWHRTAQATLAAYRSAIAKV
jgi:D-inositol-3-phosphate glycosyltransferase